MAKRQRRTRQVTKKQAQPISPLMIGIVVVGAILLVGGLILLGNQSRNTGAAGPVDLDQFPTLGAPDAPVTMVEYSDYG